MGAALTAGHGVWRSVQIHLSVSLSLRLYCHRIEVRLIQSGPGSQRQQR